MDLPDLPAFLPAFAQILWKPSDSPVEAFTVEVGPGRHPDFHRPEHTQIHAKLCLIKISVNEAHEWERSSRNNRPIKAIRIMIICIIPPTGAYSFEISISRV